MRKCPLIIMFSDFKLLSRILKLIEEIHKNKIKSNKIKKKEITKEKNNNKKTKENRIRTKKKPVNESSRTFTKLVEIKTQQNGPTDICRTSSLEVCMWPLSKAHLPSRKPRGRRPLKSKAGKKDKP